ncbi:hypothetical protein SAMN05421796_101405 [Chryseobacterium piscicola]|nr:hypothetical protein [Chryseobacterium piscicola]SIS58316.1 hypothetical protein SAMN05421796_101405 [Chryseobacterium piscicola]
MKSKLQFVIIFLGILSSCFGIWKMLKTETMILSPWFLVLLFLPILLFISFLLGYFLKIILKSEWNTLTFTSVFVIIICSIFYASQYRPTNKVVIPKNFSGEVKLFVSNEKGNDFKINNFGVGYIDKETFDKGFYPKIIKENNDITDQVKLYSKGSWVTTEKTDYSFEYLTFIIPPKKEHNKDVGELLKVNAIDITRLPKK